MSKSGSLTSDDPFLDNCGSCNAAVVDKAMQCDLCNRWTHNGCSGMPEDLYKVIMKHQKKNTGTKWFCKTCEIHFGKVRMEIKILNERQVVVESKQLDAEKTINQVKIEISELKKDLAAYVQKRDEIAVISSDNVGSKIEEIKEEISVMKKSYSDMVKGTDVGLGTSISLTNAPSRTIKVEVSEVMEREKRKNNLVIFGIEETNDEMATKDRLKVIVNALELEESKIKYVGRVGRYVEGSRARIVRVECNDSETKRKFLKGANKLKTMEGFNNIYISLDLTKIQQAQDKLLREKLKEHRLVHKEAKINNGEVVIFENGSRKTLFSSQQ